MPNYWIMKTEPESYSHADLARDKRTTWDGVANPVALKHLRAMQPGDEVMIYHTGKEKSVVGLARVIGDDSKLGLVKLEAGRPLARPVSLAAIKADKTFADLGLVRMGRLSVMPVPEAQWRRLLKMAAEGGA